MTHRRRCPTARLETVAPEALFVVSAVSLYLGATIAVSLFDRLDPATVAWLRVVTAAAMVTIWRRSWRRRWTPSELAWAAAFGTALAAMNTLFYLATDRLALGSGVAVEFIGPIAVALVGARTPRNLTALGAAVAGIALMSGFSTGQERIGVLLALGAGVLWAGYIVFGSRVAHGSAVDGLGVGMAIGALVIAPVGVRDLGTAVDTPGLLAACAAVGLLSNVVPYGIDQVVLRRLSPGRFALLLALLPAVATLCGFLLLGQTPSTAELIGIAAVMVGIAIRDRTGESPPVTVAEA